MNDIIKTYRKGSITKDVIKLLEKLRLEKDVELVKEVLREIFSGNDLQNNISEYKIIRTLEPLSDFFKYDYSDELIKTFPTCKFLGPEGFIGITKDLKPIYEINKRIDDLWKDNLGHLTSNYLSLTVVEEYRLNDDVVFVGDKKSVDIILNSYERSWQSECNARRIANEEAEHIKICELERLQYEDVFDGANEY